MTEDLGNDDVTCCRGTRLPSGNSRRKYEEVPNLLRVGLERCISPKRKHPANLTGPAASLLGGPAAAAPPSGALDTLRGRQLTIMHQRAHLRSQACVVSRLQKRCQPSLPKPPRESHHYYDTLLCHLANATLHGLSAPTRVACFQGKDGAFALKQ